MVVDKRPPGVDSTPHLIGLRTIKTAIGATIAIIISNVIGLEYATSAGIITILSIQNTRKASVTLAFQRFGSTILALFIAGILFALVGYNAIAFGLYLAIFIPLAVKFKITDRKPGFLLLCRSISGHFPWAFVGFPTKPALEWGLL